MTVDVSDNGGTSFGVTGGSTDAYIDTTSLSTGTGVALKFNLTGTTTSPKVYGYGVLVLDDS